MKILITNDDGIGAAGLLPLARWASRLGEVTVIAPKLEQSGKSHGIEIHRPFEVRRVELAPDIAAYALDSTPADCVRFAVLGLKEKFDLVISGINRGLNVGQDIIYSGTVAAIFEARALGIPAIALSTSPDYYYEQALSHLDEVYDYVTDHKLLDICPLYNINIPSNPVGFRITRQGGPYYSDRFEDIGNDLYMPHGIDIFRESGTDLLDTDAVLVHHLISITPLQIDRTHHETYHRLQHLNPQQKTQ